MKTPNGYYVHSTTYGQVVFLPQTNLDKITGEHEKRTWFEERQKEQFENKAESLIHNRNFSGLRGLLEYSTYGFDDQYVKTQFERAILETRRAGEFNETIELLQFLEQHTSDSAKKQEYVKRKEQYGHLVEALWNLGGSEIDDNLLTPETRAISHIVDGNYPDLSGMASTGEIRKEDVLNLLFQTEKAYSVLKNKPPTTCENIDKEVGMGPYLTKYLMHKLIEKGLATTK